MIEYDTGGRDLGPWKRGDFVKFDVGDISLM